MSVTISEADMIFNRANVALAKSQRLIASWLPPRTDEELRNAKSLEEIEKEEEEIFKPSPELLGLGATVPKDGDVKRQDLSSNDKLRKQLLGSDFAKKYGRTNGGGKAGFVVTLAGSKPRPVATKAMVQDDDEDEEGGRSSLGRSKRKRDALRLETEDALGLGDKVTRVADDKKSEGTRQVKKSAIFLDEVLAEKQRKKQKKKRNSSMPGEV